MRDMMKLLGAGCHNNFWGDGAHHLHCCLSRNPLREQQQQLRRCLLNDPQIIQQQRRSSRNTAFVVHPPQQHKSKIQRTKMDNNNNNRNVEHSHNRQQNNRLVGSSLTSLHSLVPIPVNELQDILPTPSKLSPNGDQYVTYFGRTPQQRFNSLFEGVSIAFLGSMFAYFISFVIGQFMASILGVIFLFWPILSPEFKAYQRNWELVGGRDLVDVWMDEEADGTYDDRYWSGLPEDKRGLYGAYYVSQIEDVCVVDDVRASSDEEYDLEEFSGYTMATDELESVTGLPWKLRLRLSDDEGRGMQVHSRMSEEYLDIQPGMNAVGVLLSTSKKFGQLAGITDFCVLDEVDGAAVAWVGDYPYLDKDIFLRTLSQNGVTDSLLDFEADKEDDYDEDNEDNDTDDDDIEEVDAEEEYITIR